LEKIFDRDLHDSCHGSRTTYYDSLNYI